MVCTLWLGNAQSADWLKQFVGTHKYKTSHIGHVTVSYLQYPCTSRSRVGLVFLGPSCNSHTPWATFQPFQSTPLHELWQH